MIETDINEKTELDAIDSVIVERLGERQRKIDRMAEMEREFSREDHGRRNMAVWITSAVAACMIGFFLISHLFQPQTNPLERCGIECPQLTMVRAATPEWNEIQNLVEQEQWKEACVRVKQALNVSDEELSKWNSIENQDEGQMYEAETEKEFNDQLRWLYIYLLVRTEQYDEAEEQMNLYVKQPLEHDAEAKALLKEIKKKFFIE